LLNTASIRGFTNQ